MASTSPRLSPLAILTTYYRPVVGGVETAAERLAGYLARRGHPVTVVTKRTRSQHPRDEVIDGVAVRRVPPVGERRAFGKWLAIPSMFVELLRRRRSIRVICCVDFRGVGVAALLAGMLTGAPVVFETSTDGTVSGEPLRKRVARMGLSPTGAVAETVTWPIRAIYSRADLFVCVSHALERELVQCGVPSDRIRYLPHPVEVATFHPIDPAARAERRRALGLPVNATIAIFVGRLSREKGVAELIDAWSQVSLPGIHLVLVGPDMTGHRWDAGPAARREVASRGLTGTVTFTGALARAEVARWLQAADLAVAPSHFEAFGIAAAEAMSTGLPVVASDVGGFRDYVENGVNGVRVPPRDTDALAVALGQVLGDAGLRHRLAEGALATARRFDEQVVLDQFAGLIEGLADRG